jgi:Nuclease-related domain
MFDKKRERLPPVRRRAGESLREKRENLIDDKLPPIIFLPFVFWFVFLVCEIQQLNQFARQPQFWLCAAVIASGMACISFRRLLPIAKRLNRGEHGEHHVADTLEELRSDGYKPVHDIVVENFNVDHVLVGPGGVFAIETKFRSGKGEITFRNGEGLFVDGRLEEKDCLKQARGNAAAIRRMIKETCGRQDWVKALVVFVGDWRVKDDWRDTDVRVFTPDRLPRYIRNQQPQLKKSEIDFIASHLERCAK